MRSIAKPLKKLRSRTTRHDVDSWNSFTEYKNAIPITTTSKVMGSWVLVGVKHATLAIILCLSCLGSMGMGSMNRSIR